MQELIGQVASGRVGAGHRIVRPSSVCGGDGGRQCRSAVAAERLSDATVLVTLLVSELDDQAVQGVTHLSEKAGRGGVGPAWYVGCAGELVKATLQGSGLAQHRGGALGARGRLHGVCGAHPTGTAGLLVSSGMTSASTELRTSTGS